MRTVVFTAILALALPAVAAAEDDRPAILGMVGGPAADDPLPRSTYMILDVPGGDSAPSAIPGGPPTIFYINKNGGTYRPGNNDARTNYSSIVDSPSTIAPWNVSAAGWTTVKTCMTTMFSRWNVTITDVDPGNVPHYEIVIAGDPQDIGMEDGVGGVSPFSGNCGVINNSIVYTFANVYGNQYRDVCETAAQEVAHSFGLDHEFLCADPMTYLYNCGNKSFQNVAAQCGEYSARSCQCGGSTQNSVTMLDARLGLAGSVVPPTVSITSPANNATVSAGFTVAVSASDDMSVSRTELWIDGAQTASDTTAPYSFATGSGLAAGSHTVQARAYDNGEAMSSAQITVTISGGGGGGGGSDPDAGPGGGGGGGDPDAGPGGGAAGGDDEGTAEAWVGGCSTGSSGAGLGTLLLLGLLAAARRS